ncbi:uncharacterized protein LOC134467271 [Engraulis encrasicolus]|uniref:uncharacterized protein LOC134467271 n=1 Tax=Engraulis encrasicolus TaxID=184585 RepID=UPI002FD0750C
MRKGTEDPFQYEPGPGSSHSDGPSSPQPFTVQEYISNLSEEDWMAFSSLLNPPMTRSQFVEICQTVLKVASSSSMGLILPAFARMERDLECYSYSPSRFKSAGSSSSDRTTGAPVGLGGMLRMQGALAAFHKCTAAWRRPVSALANAVRPSTVTKLRIYCAKRRPSPDLPDVTVTRPSTVTELRVYSANRMASLDLPEVVSVLRQEGESQDPTGIDRILEKVLSNEGIDHVAKHLVDQMHGVLQEGRLPETTSQCSPSSQLTEMYSYAEAAIKDLLQPYFLPLVAHAASVDNAEFRGAAFAAADAVDGVQAKAKAEDAISSQSRAQSARSSTASCELDTIHPDSSALQVHASMVSFFTDLMVNQVLDKLHLDIPAQQDAADEPDTASAGGPDGCLTSVLMLRLLANMRDGGRSSVDKGLQELIDKILSELSGPSGVPNVHGYLNNTGIQNINRTMEKFLLKEFGSKNILQRAANPKDNSFNMTFLAKLREVLNAEATGAPSALSGSAFPGSDSGPKAAGGMKTGKKSKFGVKIPNRRKRSSKVSPIGVAADKGQQTVTPAPSGNTSAAPADKVKPRKRSWIKKLFSCCVPSETQF